MNWRENSLDILGLNETEKGILECLAVAKSIQTIAIETKISRTGINHCLKKLYKKDLVSTIKLGKRKLYIAVTEKELLNKLELLIISMEANRDRKGAKVRISKENEFIIHIGTKEIIPAYSRIASLNKEERIQAIQHHRSYKEIVEKASSKLLVEFNEVVKKNNIILDGILNESAYAAYTQEMKVNPKKYKGSVESLEGRMADYHVFPDNFFNHDAEIWLFKTSTLIINWHEEVAIEIINKNITGFLKDMFHYVKEGSRKIDHNQAMRELLEKAE